MTRIKRGTQKTAKRRALLARTKGYRLGRSSKTREAKQALIRAGQHAFKHRRVKKRDFRRAWNVRINAGLDAIGSTLSYSKLMGALTKSGIGVNRKMLAELAEHKPDTFKRIVDSAQ